MADYAEAGRALERRLHAGRTVAEALDELVEALPAGQQPRVGGQVLRFVP